MRMGENMSWETVHKEYEVWRADYDSGGGSATSCVIANDHDLILISAPAGEQAGPLLDALAEMGNVTAIVVPCRAHRLGILAAKAKFPNAPIYCDPRIAAHVSKIAGEVEPLEALQATLPDHIEIFAAQYMKQPDTIARIHTPDGTIWYFNDLITNIQSLPFSLTATMLRLLGFKIGIYFNRFFVRVMGSDKQALRQWLLNEITAHPPIAVIFGHGPVAKSDELAKVYAVLKP